MGYTCECACNRNSTGDLVGLCGLHAAYLRDVTERNKEETRKEAIQDVIRSYEEALDQIGGINATKKKMIELYIKGQLNA